MQLFTRVAMHRRVAFEQQTMKEEELTVSLLQLRTDFYI